jgi:TRAP-type C4-dicarboxylate transport system permease small subunit
LDDELRVGDLFQMQRLLMMADKAIQWLCTASLAIAAVFIGVLAIIGVADIFGTNLFGKPVPSALEFSEAGLAVIVFMGLAQAQRKRAHITVDILSASFKGWAEAASTALALIAAILFFGFVAWRGGLAAWESVLIDERSMGQSPFPLWPGKILLCIGCIIAMLESLRQLVRLLCGMPDETWGVRDETSVAPSEERL